jgi:hypothetical protein
LRTFLMWKGCLVGIGFLNPYVLGSWALLFSVRNLDDIVCFAVLVLRM